MTECIDRRSSQLRPTLSFVSLTWAVVTFGVRTAADAFAVRKQRRSLRALDERMLSDLGLSRADVEREASRRFFDLPGRDDR